MVYHVSPSIGQRCGIASFAAKLDVALPDSKLVANVPKKSNPNDILLLEHEYGLQRRIDFQLLAEFQGRKVIIQHAYSDNKVYESLNSIVFRLFDKIIFLNRRQKIKASCMYPAEISKMVIIPHYAEELRYKYQPLNSNKYTIGIHGFAFPRNGFLRMLNSYKGKQKLYIMATISEFDKTAELETSTYLDKIRRRIWSMGTQGDNIKLDFNYYNTKTEIIDKMREKCDTLIHMTQPTPGYYNSSGSLNVLLATGLPVVALDSIFTTDIPRDAITVIDSPDTAFNLTPDAITTTSNGVDAYHAERSVSAIAQRIYKVAIS